MRTELISIATATLPLDGAFYLPDAAASGTVMLTRLGFACLALTRRLQNEGSAAGAGEVHFRRE